MAQKKFDSSRKIEEMPARLYIILAILAFAAHIIICTLTPAKPSTVGLAFIIGYLVVSAVIFFITKRKFNIFKSESDASDEHNNGVVYAFKNYANVPYALVTDSGKIITVNNAMRQAAGKWDTVFNSDISSICGMPLDEILFLTEEEKKNSEDTEHDGEYDIQQEEKKEKKQCIVTVNEKKFHVACHAIDSSKKPYYLVIFDDVTELLALTELHNNEHTAVGYIVLDNLDELAQYVKVSYENEVLQVEKKLRQWASEMNAVLRSYDRSKYMVILNREKLDICIADKFDNILNAISDVRVGEESMPITASVGIAVTGDTLAEREQDALLALDMAFQRGGAQVVLKTKEGNEYFGGRTKSQQKRTGKQSRIIANHLCTLICNSSNVIVMGHSNPDFDSIGACVGIASLCMYLGVDVKIVMDLNSENFKICTSKLKNFAVYKNMFVDGVDGLEECTFSTLLIVVDANNFSILESPEIAANSFKTVVIDHHIKKQEFEEAPLLQYIDPSASSACELVSEILEFSIPTGKLRKEEANILMSGIMVDTNNFTRTVGTRTFAAALYLRSAGASTEYARTFFEEAFEDYRAEALFGSEAKIFRDQIAITAIEGTGSPADRVAAAKAANKLLTDKNVNAAFALIRVGTTVFISARSNGSINVQLILERIGGGGHFDVAGAALAETELKDAEKLLTETIDNYFAETAKVQKNDK